MAQIGTTGSAAVSCDNAEYLDSTLTAATVAASAKSGYYFPLVGATAVAATADVPAGGYVDGYVSAVPAAKGTSGSDELSDAGVVAQIPRLAPAGKTVSGSHDSTAVNDGITRRSGRFEFSLLLRSEHRDPVFCWLCAYDDK